jgi:hypothetical protein
MRLNNPAPGRPVTSPYGWRIHPITKRKAFHRGTDFGGTFDVLAAGDGHTSTSRFAQNKLGGQTPTQHPILKNKNPAKLRLMANWVSKRGVQSRNILKKSVIMKVVWTGAPEDSLFPVFNEP